MTGAGLGTAVFLVCLAAIPACAVWAKLLRGRDPSSLVITTMYQDCPATAVRGRDNFVPATAFLGLIAAALAFGAFLAWPTDPGVTVLLLGPATYFGIAAWLFATGRVGDATVWFTRDGIAQRANGLEQSMFWDDLVAMQPDWDGLALDSSAPITAHRYAPRAWVGRARSVDPTMKVLMGNLPAVHLVAAIDRWATDDFARLEIGTPDALERLLGTRV